MYMVLIRKTSACKLTQKSEKKHLYLILSRRVHIFYIPAPCSLVKALQIVIYRKTKPEYISLHNSSILTQVCFIGVVYRIQLQLCCSCKSKVAFSNSETDFKDIRADCRLQRLTFYSYLVGIKLIRLSHLSR